MAAVIAAVVGDVTNTRTTMLKRLFVPGNNRNTRYAVCRANRGPGSIIGSRGGGELIQVLATIGRFPSAGVDVEEGHW
jgi:hypothetical protein